MSEGKQAQSTALSWLREQEAVDDATMIHTYMLNRALVFEQTLYRMRSV